MLGLLVTALLALRCMPPDAGAQQPTGTIPSIDARVTSLRFFESDYQAPPREQRAYTQRFDRAQTRYVRRAYRLRGVLYADVKRQYDRAIRDFDKAIELDPMYAEAYESRPSACGRPA
jgi:tetratricopeptide (TPR) repeat protein